jgi:hypothetical protein
MSAVRCPWCGAEIEGTSTDEAMSRREDHIRDTPACAREEATADE